MEHILEGMASAVGLLTILIYAIAAIAIVFGIVISVRRRRREKATGEAEEAKKY